MVVAMVSRSIPFGTGSTGKTMRKSATLQKLEDEHGWLLSASTTAKYLGFRNTEALRMARRQGRLAIRMFPVEGRRGFFAAAADVARWLDETLAKGRLDPEAQSTASKGDDVRPAAHLATAPLKGGPKH